MGELTSRVSRFIQGGVDSALTFKCAGGLVEFSINAGSKNIIQETCTWAIQKLDRGVLCNGVYFDTKLRHAFVNLLADTVSDIRDSIPFDFLLTANRISRKSNMRDILIVSEIFGLVTGHIHLSEILSLRINETANLSLAIAMLSTFKGIDDAAEIIQRYVENMLTNAIRQKLVDQMTIHSYIEAIPASLSYIEQLCCESYSVWNFQDWLKNVDETLQPLLQYCVEDEDIDENCNDFNVVVDTLKQISVSRNLETTSCLVAAVCAYTGMNVRPKGGPESVTDNKKTCFFSMEYPDLHRMSPGDIPGAKMTLRNVQGLMNKLVIRDSGPNGLTLSLANLEKWLKAKKLVHFNGKNSGLYWQIVGANDTVGIYSEHLNITEGDYPLTTVRGSSWLDVSESTLQKAINDLEFVLPHTSKGLKTICLWFIVSAWCSVVCGMLHNPDDLFFIRSAGDFRPVAEDMAKALGEVLSNNGTTSNIIFGICADFSEDNCLSFDLGIQSTCQIILPLTDNAGAGGSLGKFVVVGGQILGCPGVAQLNAGFFPNTFEPEESATCRYTQCTDIIYTGYDIKSQIIAIRKDTLIELSMSFNVGKNKYYQVPYRNLIACLQNAKRLVTTSSNKRPRVDVAVIDPNEVINKHCTNINKCIVLSRRNNAARMACAYKLLEDKKSFVIWDSGYNLEETFAQADNNYIVIS